MLKHDWPALCHGKLHCTLCRTKEGDGRKFRAQMVQHLIEQVAVDFACPAGYAWDAKIEPEAVPQKFVFPEGSQQPIVPVQPDENTALFRQRFEICKTCADTVDHGFGCSHHKGCCFGRWRSQQANKCPEGKW